MSNYWDEEYEKMLEEEAHFYNASSYDQWMEELEEERKEKEASTMLEIMDKFDPEITAHARLHLTTHDKKHKMAGFQSLSTSVVKNHICQVRRKVKGSICEKCYADHLLRYRKSLEDCLSRNFFILNNHLFEEREAIRCAFDTRYARTESFGDVASVTHARNYIRIIRANPETNFGIWSKNMSIWKEAFEKEGKPLNTTFVMSSAKLNEVDIVPDGMREYVDHVFTVWTPDRYTFEGTKSECAGIQCRTCLKCYKIDTPFEINERLR